MKRALLLAGVVLLFASLSTASGHFPAISDINTGSDNLLWKTEDFDIEVTCQEVSQNYDVSMENISHTDTSGEAYFFSYDDVFFEDAGNDYSLGGDDLRDATAFLSDTYRVGDYSFFVRCEDGNKVDFGSHNFSLRDLNASVSIPGDLYTGEDKDVFVKVKIEDGGSPEIVDSGDGVNFTASIGGDSVDVQPFYKGGGDNYWGINIPLPEDSGVYELNITAEHDGGRATVLKDVDVEEATQFDVNVPSGDTEVFGEETIEMTVEASDRGTDLEIGKEDITVELEDEGEITNITEDSVSKGSSTFSVFLPNKSTGEYDLEVNYSSDGLEASDTVTIGYPIRLDGAFKDADNDAMQFTLQFKEDGKTVREIDGSGEEYSSTLIPGDYGVTLSFPDPVFSGEISLSEADVDAWDEDTLTYRVYRPPGGVEGLVLAGLYGFKTGLDYESSRFSLGVDPENLDDPREMRVFYCGDWFMGRKECFGDWENIGSDIQGSTAAFDGAGDGAYAIGVREDLVVKHSDGDDTYTPDETIEVGGTVTGSESGNVKNATVRLVDGSDTVATTATDEDGIFQVEVPVPDTAGSHSFELEASKDPYADDSATFEVDVERPRRLKIASLSEVKMSANETENVSFYVKNTGFQGIDSFNLVSERIPFLESVDYDDGPIQVNQSRRITLQLAVPPNTSDRTYTAEPVFTYHGDRSSRVFGVTVETPEVVEGETETSTGMITRDASSLFAAPDLDFLSADDIVGGSTMKTIIFLVIVAQAALIAVVLVRKREAPERGHVTRTVSHIKEEIAGESPGSAEVTLPPSKEVEGDQRERVMRTFSHIKSQLDRGRN